MRSSAAMHEFGREDEHQHRQQFQAHSNSSVQFLAADYTPLRAKTNGQAFANNIKMGQEPLTFHISTTAMFTSAAEPDEPQGNNKACVLPYQAARPRHLRRWTKGAWVIRQRPSLLEHGVLIRFFVAIHNSDILLLKK
jgi:hypothetical protein